MSDERPSLVLRNAIAKSRGKKDGEMEILIGNDISNIELVRWSLKSQFDRDIVTHYDAQVCLLTTIIRACDLSSRVIIHKSGVR
jgi:actin-related protein 5